MHRDERSTRGRPVGRWLVGLSGAAALLLSVIMIAPAQASTTDKAQLSLTGVVDDNNPAGGSQLGIHPGDAVTFSASAAPTAKVKSLAGSIGLGGLLNSLLGSVDFQVVANFSGLPGGHSNTTLTGSKTAHFSFSHVGRYSFSYQAQQVSVGLLGKKITDINLNGNQAKKAGVELNAKNQYVGTIVVAKNPPKGGISVQLPSVQVQPKVGPVQLPKVSVPGVSVPTVRVPVPSLNPSKTKTGGTTKPGTAKPGTTATNPGISDKAQPLPVPARVVPGGYGGTTSGSGGSGGGFYANSLTGTSAFGNGQQLSLGSATNPTASNAKAAGAAKKHTTDLAAKQTPSAQLPVVLAILAIIALALVAATYARLFLLRRAT